MLLILQWIHDYLYIDITGRGSVRDANKFSFFDLPTERTIVQITEILQAHSQPQPLEITERIAFYNRKQESKESLQQFIEELKKIS